MEGRPGFDLRESPWAPAGCSCDTTGLLSLSQPAGTPCGFKARPLLLSHSESSQKFQRFPRKSKITVDFVC